MRAAIIAVFLGLAVSAMPVPQAQAADSNLPPYEDSLRRLSSIVGALMHLDPLCNKTDAQRWHQQMTDLLKAENPDDVRNSHLTARFNQSYRVISQTYTSCNSQARKVTGFYLQEGRELLTRLKLKHSR